MFFRILICLILLIIGHKLIAQDRPVETVELVPSKGNVSHYLGLQANQLIRQLLSFGGNPGAVSNPYLFTYAANSRTNGVGFSTGVGLTSITTKTSDNFTNTISTVNDFAWRFGLEKKRYFSKYWLFSMGGDVVIDLSKAETTAKSGNGGLETKVTTNTRRGGFGPRASLAFQFSEHLLVGTEGAYYFKWGNQEQTSSGTGQPNDPGTKVKSFAFALPTAVYLIVKL